MVLELFTLKQLLDALPVGERALRRIIAELGFKPAPGRRSMYFTPDDTALIVSAITASRNTNPAPAPPLNRSQKSRQTKALAEAVRNEMKAVDPD